jgi:DNA polymerase I-like protein with 3'-5' exonuclease and polymerase domains
MLFCPTLLPGSLFANQALAFAVREDWAKAARIQQHGATRVPLPMLPWQIEPQVQHVRTYFMRMVTDPGPWVIDFEATLMGEPVCLSIWSAYKPMFHRGICIPFLNQGGSRYWSMEDEATVMGLVTWFFLDPYFKKWGHNLAGYDTGVPPFNWRALIKTAWNLDVAGVEGDTMAAHHVTFAELRHSLAFLASMVTDQRSYKLDVWKDDDGDEDVKAKPEWSRILDRPNEKTRTYCNEDTFSTAVGHNVLVAEMDTLGCRAIHDTIALPLIPIVQEVGYRGMPIDTTLRDDMIFDLDLRKGAVGQRLREAGVTTMNSPQKLGWQLKDLGVPLVETTEGGQFRTDLETIGKMNWKLNTLPAKKGGESQFPFLSLIKEYRRLEKASKNLASLIPCDDGLLRTRMQAIGTVTARYASAGFGTKDKPGWCNICKTWGAHGTNLQNIPKDNKELGVNVKDVFHASPGWLLGELDYRAYELVIQAHRIKSEKMISRLETPGADPHSLHAKLMYPDFAGKGTPSGDRQRGTMKNVIYGKRGGGGNRALQSALAKKDEFFELPEIEEFRVVLDAEYPEEPEWITWTGHMLENQLLNGERRVIYNAFGRPRVLMGREPLKAALATEISGTGAEIMNCVFLRMAIYHPEEFKYICLQIHDSILVHAPKAIFWHVVEVVKAEMERAVWMWGEFVTFGVDVKFGERWTGMKEAA